MPVERILRLPADDAGLDAAAGMLGDRAARGDTILVTRNTRDFPAEMPGIRVPYTL